MRITFRTDASFLIGNGHVMRCLTLAEVLRSHGADCNFISRAHPGHLIDIIRQRSFAVNELPVCMRNQDVSQSLRISPLSHIDYETWLGSNWETDAAQTSSILTELQPDWLVADHYALDRSWEETLTPNYKKLMIIDDLAHRPHTCDLLLDQSLNRKEKDYNQLVPTTCRLLTGTSYALLRPEFALLREYSLQRRANVSNVEQILISMGGVDQVNATEKVLSAMKNCGLPKNCQITVVMGPKAPWVNKVQELALRMPWATQVFVNPNNFAQLLANCDIAIGAAGSSAWERCCLGVPTLIMVLAENQRGIATALENARAAVSLEIQVADFNEVFNAKLLNLINNDYDSIGIAASEITNGLGSKLVAEQMLGWQKL